MDHRDPAAVVDDHPATGDDHRATGGPPPGSSSVGNRKQDLRRLLLAARRIRPAAERATAQQANAAHLTAVLSRYRLVCGYLPLPSEPLSAVLLDLLAGSGTEVLVPVISADAPLDWSRHPAPTALGAFGIAEPVGPRLGPQAICRADAIVVPALAVDRAGRRLGRGGGHYDRSLALLRPQTLPSASPCVIAVLFDDEMVDEVPVDFHDRPVDAVVTPTGGYRSLPS